MHKLYYNHSQIWTFFISGQSLQSQHNMAFILLSLCEVQEDGTWWESSSVLKQCLNSNFAIGQHFSLWGLCDKKKVNMVMSMLTLGENRLFKHLNLKILFGGNLALFINVTLSCYSSKALENVCFCTWEQFDTNCFVLRISCCVMSGLLLLWFCFCKNFPLILFGPHYWVFRLTFSRNGSVLNTPALKK